jgi:hypothetical protein
MFISHLQVVPSSSSISKTSECHLVVTLARFTRKNVAANSPVDALNDSGVESDQIKRTSPAKRSGFDAISVSTAADGRKL